jgi:cytoskeletal protein CcmA (bactofilin family)
MTNTKNACPPVDKLMGIESKDVTSLVDDGVEIEGVIRIKNGQAILITGTVVGSIDSNGPVIINTTGEVRGSIKASALQVGGKVLRSDESDLLVIDGPLVLSETSHLGCDAESTGVQMAYGASIDGSIRPRKDSDGKIIPAQSLKQAAVTAPVAVAPSRSVVPPAAPAVASPAASQLGTPFVAAPAPIPAF